MAVRNNIGIVARLSEKVNYPKHLWSQLVRIIGVLLYPYFITSYAGLLLKLAEHQPCNNETLLHKGRLSQIVSFCGFILRKEI